MKDDARELEELFHRALEAQHEAVEQILRPLRRDAPALAVQLEALLAIDACGQSPIDTPAIEGLTPRRSAGGSNAANDSAL